MCSNSKQNLTLAAGVPGTGQAAGSEALSGPARDGADSADASDPAHPLHALFRFNCSNEAPFRTLLPLPFVVSEQAQLLRETPGALPS